MTRSGNRACSRNWSAVAPDGTPAKGRMEHRITTPSAVSVQLQPSRSLVCTAPVVTPVDSVLTSRSCTGEYVTAANP